MVEPEAPERSNGLFSDIITERIISPVNLLLMGATAFLVYKIIKSRRQVPAPVYQESKLPKLRRDFTVEELKNYDGKQPDGRILVGVNGQVFDVTKGKRFYGPGGPYSVLGGRDASRNLATFNMVDLKEGFDDLSDLTQHEMESLREWEIQFKEKYDYVGRLLRPGEEPTNYSDEEEESINTDPEKNKENPKFE